MKNAIQKLLPSSKGRVLALAGSLFVLIGLGNIVTADELSPTLPSYQAYRAQFVIVESLVFWGALFCLAGATAVFFSFKEKLHHWGFFSLMLMASWWGTLFIASLVSTGYTRIVPSIFMWGLLVVFLYTVSTWQECPNED